MSSLYRAGGAIALLSCFLAACGGSGTTVGAPQAGSPATTVTSPSNGAPVPVATPTQTARASSSPTTPTPAPLSTVAVSSSVACGTGSAEPGVPFAASPDPDAFYAQPQPIPNLPRGTILASRSVTYSPDGTPASNQAYEIKFISCDTYMNPIAAVATVVKPLSYVGSTKPLFVEALAEDSLSALCAPSHTATGSTTESNGDLEVAGVPETGLAQGWTVVYPDFEGPNSDYGPGPLAGQITLDSVTAAEQFAPLGLSTTTPVGMSGYSGGGIAMGWAATLQHTYAPALNIVAIASGGTPANPKSIGDNINTNAVANAAFFDIIFMSAVGTNRMYPQFLSPIFNAKGVTAATSIENGCVGNQSNGSAGPTGHTSDYITVSDFDTAPGVLSTFALTTLPQSGRSPVADVFVYHSQTDELIPIAGVDPMVAAWCAAGSTVAYYRALSGDHISTEADNVQNVAAYITARFNGIAPVYPATTTTCNE